MRLYKRNEFGAVPAGTGLTSSTVAKYFEVEGADEKTVFLITTTKADNVVVCHGVGSVNKNDITLDIKDAGTYAITLDTAFFMDSTGTNKGKIGFKGDSTTKVAVVVLP